MYSPPYTLEDLVNALGRAGIETGGTVVMHSSLYHLGRLPNASIPEYPSRIVQTICSYLGPDGTLAVPAPNMDYGVKRLPFDVQRTAVTKAFGVIGMHVAGLAECKRSPNPIFSLATLGAQAEFICGGGVATAFGVDSAWDRLYRLNADILFLGCGLEFMTFVRYMEFRFGVPYLYNKLFDTPILDGGTPINMAVVALLRYAHCQIEYDLTRFEQRLREAGVLRETTLGGGKVFAVRMDRCFEIGVEALKEDIHFFLARRPDYLSGQVPIV